MRTPSEAVDELLARPPMPDVVEAALEHPAPVFAVGGALRDAILERPPADLDVAVGGDFQLFIDSFSRCCGRRGIPRADR